MSVCGRTNKETWHATWPELKWTKDEHDQSNGGIRSQFLHESLPLGIHASRIH
jgi:hypothetical protein